ncbi:hypothetical protein Agabi119p4_2636 [Agaricus bisporus var. burnettii]|uniref:Senescence domain-containing protein n=1 Tax=Agaricus bisporus var. burnettii TaxID=192524 RepID=A0A8H7F9H5_AGABI|nr:hypothetical protein Agabi119p4_2636 [Agaricus bisporus var. burnettii]
MIMELPEAFLLLTLPNCSLSCKDFSESGTLGLECVTLPTPNATDPSDCEVYLVLKLNTTEIPIDPTRVIQCSNTPVARVYTFNPNDPNELVLTVATVTGNSKHDSLSEDLDTFESLLEQYVLDFRPSLSSSSSFSTLPPPSRNVNDAIDLRGHLVMINEDTGEVIGQVEDRFNIREDPGMYERGHEKDPIVIDVPDEDGLRESDVNAMEAFARIIPPDQQDWITKSATVVTHAISFTTNLLVTTIGSASDYYISKSAPSRHHTSTNLTTQRPRTLSPNLRAPSPTPPPLPPRALVFLTSERTRRGLRSVHSVSGQAAKVSAKTVKTIDNMIRRAMGAKPKQNRLGLGRSSSPIPPSNPNSPPPVPYTPRVVDKAGSVYGSSTSVLQSGEWNPDSKPPLPPRSQSKLSAKNRILISADLVLSTFDNSVSRILDNGFTNLGKVMNHKYGPEAAESTVLMAGTARNVRLVYVDMKGFGRRALLRKAGKELVNGIFQNEQSRKRPVPAVPRK